MQIEFFKEIFSRYSSLKFDPSHEDDRAWALQGLERRLWCEYGAAGGYGVLGGKFLGRSLLWRKAKEGLPRISFPKGKSVPSWSWMGVMGPIAYLDAPYGQVKWNDEVVSPFPLEPDANDLSQDVGDLRAVARDIAQDVQTSKLIFDREAEAPNVENLKCVIVGSDKDELTQSDQNHYVLLVAAVDKKEDCSDYKRVGVAVLSTGDVEFGNLEDEGKVRIV